MKFLFGLILMIGLFHGPSMAQETPAETFQNESYEEEFDEGEEMEFDEGDEEFDDTSSDYGIEDEDPNQGNWFKQAFAQTRFTLQYERSEKNYAPVRTINNRASMRLEYSQFFAKYFTALLDSKTSVYFYQDHLARAKDRDVRLETNVREAYIQASIGDTSIKLGQQVVIWGEADGSVVTDVISPRDNSELFFISLEESRIGQPMLTADQFTSWGTWSLLYNPFPLADKDAEDDSEYDLGGLSAFKVEEADSDFNTDEYGFRWKQTFGKSDLSIMLANLLQNQTLHEQTGKTSRRRKSVLRKIYPRYQMAGTAFNFASGNFLWKGELAYKAGRTFQKNVNFEVIERDVVDQALGVEYDANGSYQLTLEGSSQHIIDWDQGIQGTKEEESTVFMSFNKQFFYETWDLTVSTSYQAQDEDFVYQIQNKYEASDHLSLEADFTYLDFEKDSRLYAFHDQSRVTGRILYKF